MSKPEENQPVKHILVVDDEDTARKRLLEMLYERNEKLKAEGGVELEIYDTSSAEGALRYLDSGIFGLNAIISDLNMPGLSGLDLLKEMRQRRYFLPVIIVSGYPLAEKAIKELLHHGAFSFLQKPIDPDELFEHVTAALDENFYPIELLSHSEDKLAIKVSSAQNSRILYCFFSSLSDFDETRKENIFAVFDELLRNAQEWGNDDDPRKKVTIVYTRSPEYEEYKIQDEGQGFNKDKVHHSYFFNKDVNHFELQKIRKEKNLRPGGLGLALASQVLEKIHGKNEIIYNETGNEVTFRIHKE